jgi:hypothetical protein
LAVLAAVRDNEIEYFVNPKIPHNHRPWMRGNPVVSYRSHGFDVSSQITALRRRQLIRYTRMPHIFILTPTGAAALEGTEF